MTVRVAPVRAMINTANVFVVVKVGIGRRISDGVFNYMLHLEIAIANGHDKMRVGWLCLLFVDGVALLGFIVFVFRLVDVLSFVIRFLLIIFFAFTSFFPVLRHIKIVLLRLVIVRLLLLFLLLLLLLVFLLLSILLVFFGRLGFRLGFCFRRSLCFRRDSDGLLVLSFLLLRLRRLRF